jgi:hypothetical protein
MLGNVPLLSLQEAAVAAEMAVSQEDWEGLRGPGSTRDEGHAQADSLTASSDGGGGGGGGGGREDRRAEWVKRVAGPKAAAAALHLSNQIQSVSSRIKAHAVGDDWKRRKGYIQKVSSMFRGSLISEEEMQRIRRKRESGKTEAERAHELYWSMYQDHLAGTAAEAFSEASQTLKADQACQPWSGASGSQQQQPTTASMTVNGVTPSSEAAGTSGMATEVGMRADDIQEQLSSISAALALPEEEAVDDGQGRSEGGEVEDEVDKSEEMIELEALVAQQREDRAAFNERLKQEQQALADVTVRADQTSIDPAELKRLIKAATLSGYRLAQLQQEREERASESKLTELQRQRAKFEAFAGAQRKHLQQQADKVNQLLSDVAQRAKYAAALGQEEREEREERELASRLVASGDALLGAPRAGTWTGPLYRRPLASLLAGAAGQEGCKACELASAQGQSLFRRCPRRSHAMATAILQVCTMSPMPKTLNAIGVAIFQVCNRPLAPGTSYFTCPALHLNPKRAVAGRERPVRGRLRARASRSGGAAGGACSGAECTGGGCWALVGGPLALVLSHVAALVAALQGAPARGRRRAGDASSNSRCRG